MIAASFRVRWTTTAEEDLAEIVDYIADDDPDAAVIMLDRMRNHVAALRSFPARGRIVPELKRFGISNHRELLPSPWRIIYRIEEKTVFVTAVLDGRRDLEELLLERVGRNLGLKKQGA